LGTRYRVPEGDECPPRKGNYVYMPGYIIRGYQIVSIVTTVEAARVQLLQMGKTTAVKYSSTGEFIAYLVDKIEYNADKLIWLANSFVSNAIPRSLLGCQQ
jgi:hypothetical protein